MLRGEAHTVRSIWGVHGEDGDGGERGGAGRSDVERRRNGAETRDEEKCFLGACCSAVVCMAASERAFEADDAASASTAATFVRVHPSSLLTGAGGNSDSLAFDPAAARARSPG